MEKFNKELNNFVEDSLKEKWRKNGSERRKLQYIKIDAPSNTIPRSL